MKKQQVFLRKEKKMTTNEQTRVNWYLYDLALNNMKVSAQGLRETITGAAESLSQLEKEIRDMEQITARLRAPQVATSRRIRTVPQSQFPLALPEVEESNVVLYNPEQRPGPDYVWDRVWEMWRHRLAR